jgi:ATP-dependent helicase Lhr and Lhr-like helicase
MSSIFNRLHPSIQHLLNENDILHPTEPQKKAIPPILGQNHVLLLAPTGHGKTEAAILPVLDQFIRNNKQRKTDEKGISILYVTPLRALNRDMLRRTFEWGESLGISIAVRHGDTSQKERAQQSRNPPDMLITTPETLQILFTGKRLRSHLHHIRWIIIDEIHELAYDERGAQLAVALERLEELTKKDGHSFQRIGLSATVGSADEVSSYLVGFSNDEPRLVTIVDVDATKNVELAVELPTVTKEHERLAAKFSMDSTSVSALLRCKQLVDDHVSTLLFINTRDGAEILASRFHQHYPNFPIGVHHGSLSKDARIEAEDQFKESKLHALICTSSLELGIDVGQTDFVIQYNSPREVTRIVQRVGRSGHTSSAISKGLILATNPEDLAESLVIARKTLHGELEPLRVRKNPLSVLSNQVISIALEYRSIEKTQLFSVIRRAYPFHTLSLQDFNRIIEQLRNQRSIWVENETIGKRRRSRTYFLDNISMIPDEKTYVAIDISSRKRIGKLDESFVLNYGFEGARFILHGRPWIIIKREEEEILVSQSKEIGEVPSWTGEDIPVPYSVAQEVGRLRRRIAENQHVSEYPCDHHSFKQLQNHILQQQRKGFVVPDDHTITIDVEDQTMIINVCGGTKVNETIGRIISALLSQSIGESIGITNDPYRIQLELPGRIPPQKIKDILESIKPESIDYLLQTIISNSTYIRWQLVHAARKFGALRKDFDVKNIGVRRLFALFEHTPIFSEAIDKLIWDRMDIEYTATILEKIQTGAIQIHIQGLSPIGLAGTETMRGLMAPKRADRTILMALKRRLEDTSITFACVNCKKTWRSSVGRTDKKPQCPRCHAIKIAVLPRYREEEFEVLSKNKSSKEVQRIYKNSSLVLSYGKPAIMALMGRGIGPDTAARILRKHDPVLLKKSEEDEIRFLRDIHKAEVHYARTRGFWDS